MNAHLIARKNRKNDTRQVSIRLPAALLPFAVGNLKQRRCHVLSTSYPFHGEFTLTVSTWAIKIKKNPSIFFCFLIYI